MLYDLFVLFIINMSRSAAHYFDRERFRYSLHKGLFKSVQKPILAIIGIRAYMSFHHIFAYFSGIYGDFVLSYNMIFIYVQPI